MLKSCVWIVSLMLIAGQAAGGARVLEGLWWEGGQSTGASQQSGPDRLYRQGQDAVNSQQWEKAIELFAEAARAQGERADGSLYWKAYSEFKGGRADQALATLRNLNTSFPESKWRNDGQALELEIRNSTGQPAQVEEESNLDLKLLALNGLAQSNPEKALPILSSILQGDNPEALKERALFVLMQNPSPEARQIAAQAARGETYPALQLKAIRYLGLFAGTGGQEVLKELYASSPNLDVKRAILRGYMISGKHEALLTAAKTDKQPELRVEAIRQLGVMGKQDDLWSLYQTDNSVEIKKEILRALFVAGRVEKLAEIARTEKDPELRGQAVQNLGLTGSKDSAQILNSIYSTEKDPGVRKMVLRAFFIQGNAPALIDLARKEKDLKMKEEMVRHLSLMQSKEAQDFLIELLKN